MSKTIIILILLAGTALIGVFYLKPAWQDFQELRKQTEDLKQISEELDELTKNKDVLIETINSLSKDDLKRINQSFPKGSRASDFLVMLENLLAKKGILLKRIEVGSITSETKSETGGQPKPSAPPVVLKAKGAISELPITLSVFGPYESIKGLLIDLEKNLRLIDAQDISFTSSGRNDPIDVTLKIKTYYQ